MESPLGYEMNCPKCGKRLEYVRKDGEPDQPIAVSSGLVAGRAFQ